MQIRVRMNHTRTQKDGWRLSEDTVEITLDDRDFAEGINLSQVLDANKSVVYHTGVHIASERNAVEGLGTTRELGG